MDGEEEKEGVENTDHMVNGSVQYQPQLLWLLIRYVKKLKLSLTYYAIR